MNFTEENLNGTNGGFSGYYTEYEHTVTDSYDNSSYKTNVQMIVNPKTGATIVGNPTEGFSVYVPSSDGTVHQYYVDQASNANATTAATQDIRGLAYLIEGNEVGDHFVDSNGSNGAFGTKAISAYGPNGELKPGSPTAGTTIPVTINGQTVNIATTNPENVNNAMTEVQDLAGGQYTAAASTTGGGTGSSGGSSGGTSGGVSYSNSNSYTSYPSGEFQEGLDGNAKEDFPWLEINYAGSADGFEQSMKSTTFNGALEYSTFIDEINTILEEGQKYINLLIDRNGEGVKKERADALEKVIELTEDFDKIKRSIEINQIRDAIETYNDNVEQAKVKKLRKELRDACEDYNKNNMTVVRQYESTTQERSSTPPRKDVLQVLSAQGGDGPDHYWIGVYDMIEYDGWFKGDLMGEVLGGLFNMKTDRMYQELTQRGYQFNIEERDDIYKLEVVGYNG